MTRVARRAREAAAWALTVGTAVAAIGLVGDLARVAGAGGTARHTMAAGLVAASTGLLLALAVAPYVTLVAALPRRIAIAVAFASALGVAWLATDLGVPRNAFYLAVPIGFAALVAGLAALAPWKRAPAVGLAVLAGSLAADASVPSVFYPELHAVAFLAAATGGVTALGALRRRLVERPRAVALGASVVASALVLATVDSAAPGWRPIAFRDGRDAARLLGFARALVDLDRDGFSPVAWGLDCDDLDPDVHPLARDAPGGGDRNCNGVDPPAAPTDAERGLAEPFGDPDLPPRSIDLFLLVTIDALRADLVRDDLTPNLAALARRGIAAERMYAAGTRTGLSMPLLSRPTPDAEPLPARLERAGVSTSLILGAEDSQFSLVRAGFRSFWMPPGRDTTADVVTARAIDDVRAHAGSPHFLWVHYFDPHDPYRDADEYRARIATTDRWIGELMRTLPLDRTAIFVTGDHGEFLGEHGLKFHGVTSYEPVVRVPGIFVAPGVAPLAYRDLVSHYDVAPTALGAFGARGSDGGELLGRSWLRLRAAPSRPLHRFVVVRSSRHVSGVHEERKTAAIVEGTWKLVDSLGEDLVELYDLAADPGELDDVAHDRPEVAARLRRALALFRDVARFP